MEQKGLDIVRRDWCPLSKDVGNYALQQVGAGDREREEGKRRRRTGGGEREGPYRYVRNLVLLDPPRPHPHTLSTLLCILNPPSP